MARMTVSNRTHDIDTPIRDRVAPEHQARVRKIINDLLHLQQAPQALANSKDWRIDVRTANGVVVARIIGDGRVIRTVLKGEGEGHWKIPKDSFSLTQLGLAGGPIRQREISLLQEIFLEAENEHKVLNSEDGFDAIPPTKRSPGIPVPMEQLWLPGFGPDAPVSSSSAPTPRMAGGQPPPTKREGKGQPPPTKKEGKGQKRNYEVSLIQEIFLEAENNYL